jgi:hypothetical protein
MTFEEKVAALSSVTIKERFNDNKKREFRSGLVQYDDGDRISHRRQKVKLYLDEFLPRPIEYAKKYRLQAYLELTEEQGEIFDNLGVNEAKLIQRQILRNKRIAANSTK